MPYTKIYVPTRKEEAGVTFAFISRLFSFSLDERFVVERPVWFSEQCDDGANIKCCYGAMENNSKLDKVSSKKEIAHWTESTDVGRSDKFAAISCGEERGTVHCIVALPDKSCRKLDVYCLGWPGISSPSLLHHGPNEQAKLQIKTRFNVLLNRMQ